MAEIPIGIADIFEYKASYEASLAITIKPDPCIMWKVASKLLGLLVLLQHTVADTDDQTSAQVNRGTFDNPASRLRPRFRYWLPDAGVDVEIVQENIKSSGAIGAGGVEFLPFYNYGGELSAAPEGSNWSKDGFGTPTYHKMFLAALKAHKEAGLAMDFPLGPNQGQGVPADPTDEGLQWDLEPFSVVVPQSGKYEGVIPGWGSGELIALVSAEVVSTKNISMDTSATASFLGTGQSSYLHLTLKSGTLENWAHKVSSAGHLSLELPTTSLSYRLFAFYQLQTHNKNLEYANSEGTTIWDNGSYVVDHYSAHGARTITKFWEKYILPGEVKDLLMEVGNYGWEDSIEILSNISWTPSLPELFQSIYGYDLKPMLPLIMYGDNNINTQSSNPGDIQCVLDTPSQGLGYVNDFRGALVAGYRTYLQELTEWVNKELKLQMSAQVSYNLPMDMEANIPFVNAPECESLQFNSNIDGYRQFTGPANLAGKRVISNEMGAVMLEAYNLPHSELLSYINRAIVGGVNQVVLHGQSYTGNYYGTTWPGYTAFQYLFSELYSDKQPSWNHGLGDVLNYTARVQYLQQSGVPRIDVAIYNKVSATNANFPTLYPSKDLIHAGYTYTYLSPDNFALPQAKVQNGILGPDGPAYKAMVITSNSNLTLESVRYIQKYARSGLPIILSGGDPGVYSTHDDSNTPVVQKAIQNLKKSRNVYSVSEGAVASKLQSLGLEPQVAVQTNGTWYSTWREDAQHAMDHAFVFCDGPGSTGTVEIASTKTPFFMDPWTGQQKPVLNYIRHGNRVSIPLSLAANQTVVIAFTNSDNGSVEHIAQMPTSILGYDVSQDGGLTLHVSASKSSQSLVLSNGTRVRLPATNIAAATTLSSWTLTAEHWEAPSNISDVTIVARKHNTTHHLSSLVSWTQIGGLKNASGLGYYSTSISWPPVSGTADGAYLVLPAISHAARVYVNGQKVPPVDLAAPRVDLSSYLKRGANEISVVVPTTMWNYIRSIIGQIESSGIPVQSVLTAVEGELPPISDNGLVGTVSLIPYISCSTNTI
ncbi:hypothetical protein N7462_008928 [Penicillium macrosclerotiorum]|uniref:uncharacterized protein n=1 Tax=Penicillium macrosclerotiorum TaxID=303699 RepID=UPI0025480BBA|nr:uncharacterized protein N7462_008928 [Penicillium macrosclerotiorum]KAJ5676031.1 hypothetical protein N7462_008928 [Penicillium macrosclerotiorum]